MDRDDQVRVQWDVQVDGTPQKLFAEYFENECIQIRKQDIKLSVGMTSIELEGAIAVLNWILKSGAIMPEVEHARDMLEDARIGLERIQ